VTWPPNIGEPLPRAEAVWYEQVKLDDWVLGTRGHGEEWQRVFQVDVENRQQVWEAIVAAVRAARITTIRDRGADGIVCGVEVELTIGERTATVTTSWHFANEESAPRLVTAYLTL
jgi:Domain of unknown function (DUF6883)